MSELKLSAKSKKGATQRLTFSYDVGKLSISPLSSACAEPSATIVEERLQQTDAIGRRNWQLL